MRSREEKNSPQFNPSNNRHNCPSIRERFRIYFFLHNNFHVRNIFYNGGSIFYSTYFSMVYEYHIIAVSCHTRAVCNVGSAQVCACACIRAHVYSVSISFDVIINLNDFIMFGILIAFTPLSSWVRRIFLHW